MTHSKRRITVAVFAAGLAALTGASAFAKDGSPTLGKERVQSTSTFTSTGGTSGDQTPSTNRYGKR